MPRYVLPSDPALSAASVTPSDTADLPNYSRFLYIGTGGSTKDLKVTTLNGSVVTFKNVAAGVFPMQAVRVWDTGTTVSNIVAMW